VLSATLLHAVVLVDAVHTWHLLFGFTVPST
jgi:hypothetical protein